MLKDGQPTNFEQLMKMIRGTINTELADNKPVRKSVSSRKVRSLLRPHLAFYKNVQTSTAVLNTR